MDFNSGPALFTSGDDNSTGFSRNGTSYFVNGAVGSDSYDGSRNNPFETIGRAIMQAQHDAGPNSIVIAPGNYNENLIVNDFGGLLMRGEGSSPDDVVVDGNYYGTGLTIEGGSEIEIRNMSFKYGTNGIYAEDLSCLTLRDIQVRDNSQYGLLSNYVADMDINKSSFLYNGYSGARIAGSSEVEVNNSMFSYNSVNGLGLDDNASVKVRSITANQNGFDDDELNGPRMGGSQANHGLAAYHNDQLEVRSSTFSENLYNGIDLQSNYEVSLLNVVAMTNRQNGANGAGNYQMLVRNGEYNGNIYGDGIILHSQPDEESFGEGYAGSVRVVGGKFWDNAYEGIYVSGYHETALVRLDVQRNGYDGVLVYGSDYARLNGIHSTNNGDDGFDVGHVRNLTVNRVVSESNRYDGLYIAGDSSTEMVNINHGEFTHNGYDGIRVDGYYGSRLNRANVRHARSTENGGSGLYINDTNYGAIVGGVFSNNGYDGIDLFDAGRFSLEDVTAKSNYYDGLFSGISSFDDRIEPGSENGNGSTLRGSLDFKRGVFANNRLNGIAISGIGVVSDSSGWQLEGGYADYYFTMKVDRVVAERNGANGIFFGEESIIPDPPEAFDLRPRARETGYGTNVRFDVYFNRGYFGNNGQDGIRADARGAFLGQSGFNLEADIQLDNVTANHNGGNGFYSDFSGFYQPVPVPVLGATGTGSGNSANVRYYFEQGSFIRNGADGINVAGPGSPGGGTGGSTVTEGEQRPEFYAEGVSAIRNGGAGLRFQTERRFNGETPLLTSGQSALESGGYQSELVARVFDGEFNDNGHDGIDIRILTDQPEDGEIGSLVVVEKVIAKRNGLNGLRLVGERFATGGEGYSQFAINADIIRGVFNNNHQDGIHMRNLRDVYLDNPTGVSNADDGFEGINIANVSGDWTFVANGDQDFIWY